MLRKIFKSGHSLAITVSPQALRELGLRLGDAVAMEIDPRQQRLVISKAMGKRQLTLNLSSRPKLGQRLAGI